MAGRGAAPASLAEKLAKGIRRPSKVNYAEPQLAPPSDLEPPPDLDGVGLEEWREQIARLVAAGMVTAGDRRAFEDYCRALTCLRHAEARVHAVELDEAIKKGYLNATIKLRGQVNLLRQQCGLTPLSRRSVKATPKAAGPAQGERYLHAITGSGKTGTHGA